MISDNRVQNNQLDARLILSILRQPLHVSGVSRPIIRRYNYMHTTIGTYTNCCIHTVVPPDDGPRYARNM